MDPSQVVQLNDTYYWAWAKVRNHYAQTDMWFDEGELAAFEANLESELQGLRPSS